MIKIKKLISLIIIIIIYQWAYTSPPPLRNCFISPPGSIELETNILTDDINHFLQKKAQKKIKKIRSLLQTIHRQLKEKDLSLDVTIVNIAHTNKGFYPISLLSSDLVFEADIITLELPDASVRPYRNNNKNESLVKNKFWKDVLSDLGFMRKIQTTFGINSDQIRYYLHRIYAHLGIPLNPEKETPIFVQLNPLTPANPRIFQKISPEKSKYQVILDRIDAAKKNELYDKRMLHLDEHDNFVDGKYLLFYYPPDKGIIELIDALQGPLAELFVKYNIDDNKRRDFIFSNILVHLFIAQIDVWQMDKALKRLRQHLNVIDKSNRKSLKYVHIGGAAHTESLNSFWNLTKNPHVQIRQAMDYRLPMPEYYFLSPLFHSENIENILSLLWFDHESKKLIFNKDKLLRYLEDFMFDHEEYFKRAFSANFFDEMRDSVPADKITIKDGRKAKEDKPISDSELVAINLLSWKKSTLLFSIPSDIVMQFFEKNSGFDHKDLYIFCVLFPNHDGNLLFSKKQLNLSQYIPQGLRDYIARTDPETDIKGKVFFLLSSKEVPLDPKVHIRRIEPGIRGHDPGAAINISK